jgi:multisubunit Na+/H+ antiporter MnhB subunit
MLLEEGRAMVLFAIDLSFLGGAIATLAVVVYFMAYYVLRYVFDQRIEEQPDYRYLIGLVSALIAAMFGICLIILALL